jgi:hypothetical protein
MLQSGAPGYSLQRSPHLPIRFALLSLLQKKKTNEGSKGWSLIASKPKDKKESKGNLHFGIVKGFVHESPNKFFSECLSGRSEP